MLNANSSRRGRNGGDLRSFLVAGVELLRLCVLRFAWLCRAKHARAAWPAWPSIKANENAINPPSTRCEEREGRGDGSVFLYFYYLLFLKLEA